MRQIHRDALGHQRRGGGDINNWMSRIKQKWEIFGKME